MMVPRSYKYSASPSRDVYREKELFRQTDKSSSAPKKSEKKRGDDRSNSEPSILSVSTPKPSIPVVIPTRTRQGVTRPNQGYGVDSRRKPNAGNRHDPSSTPPSTAALLAMTTIPEHGKRMAIRSRPRPLDSMSRRGDPDVPRRSLSSSSPQTWDFLLSPPYENDLDSSSFESDATLGPLPSIRSISTESMPSLAEDEDSTGSMSNPATPGLASSSRSERKRQSLSASVGKDCASDHPLLPPMRTEVLPEKEMEASQVPTRSPPSSRFKISFKSNLTASFRAIRSAAKTISDLTGPLPQRDDLLSRSVLSVDLPFTDERRPSPTTEPPDSALRRYLNPITLSPAELHFHGGSEAETYQSSVQLQTCQPGARRSSNASSPPIFGQADDHGATLSKSSLDVEDARTSSSVPRQREPRENSDFLRVIVLEMNMRKVGKLSDASPGRAKLWLPARQAGKKGEDDERGEEASKKVPERWASI